MSAAKAARSAGAPGSKAYSAAYMNHLREHVPGFKAYNDYSQAHPATAAEMHRARLDQRNEDRSDPMPGTKGYDALMARQGKRVGKLFSPDVQPFTERELLFGKRSSLFKTNFNDAEARDASGRWAAGGAGVKEKAKRILAVVKPTVGEGAGYAASTAAGALGLPDELATHVAAHVKAAVEHIGANPHYQRFAAKVKAKGKALFSKSSALSAGDHQELKDHIADGISTMPLHPKVASSDAALASIVRGAHDTLYRRLCNGQL